MACRGVARQGEDGRTHLVRQVRQVRQVRCKCHTHATRTPPQLSKQASIPQRHICPGQKHTESSADKAAFNRLGRNTVFLLEFGGKVLR